MERRKDMRKDFVAKVRAMIQHDYDVTCDLGKVVRKWLDLSRL